MRREWSVLRRDGGGSDSVLVLNGNVHVINDGGAFVESISGYLLRGDLCERNR